jgi:ABC-type phosphonate transport system ATPase subunit
MREPAISVESLSKNFGGQRILDDVSFEIAAGGLVVVGLKGYRLLPHYPLRSETGAKTQQQ